MTDSIPDAGKESFRRIAWVAFALGFVSLGMVSMGYIAGGSRHWTDWAVPILVTANAGVFLLPRSSLFSRLIWVYYVVSIGTAAAILINLVPRIWHR